MNDPEEVFTYTQVVSIAKTIENIRNRALFILLFLTGGRVKEVVGRVRKKDIITGKKKGKPFLIIQNFWTQKNPRHPIRTLPIPIHKEGDLVDMLFEYVDTIEATDTLFNITRQRAWQIIRPIIEANKEPSTKNIFLNANHFLRHSRNTDLILRYDFTSTQLKAWNGWSSEDPAKAYDHLMAMQLANKMV